MDEMHRRVENRHLVLEALYIKNHFKTYGFPFVFLRLLHIMDSNNQKSRGGIYVSCGKTAPFSFCDTY